MKTLLTLCLTLMPLAAYAAPNIETSVEISPRTHIGTDVGAYIELEGRAADYVEAFQQLRCQHPSANIYAVVEGISIDHIQDITTMSNDLLIMITYGHYAPYRSKIVKIENIRELGMRSIRPSPVSVYFPSSSDEIKHHHDDIHHVDDISHPHHPDIDE